MNAIQQWAPGGILDLSGARNSLARCYMEVRKTTESICRPLSAEDQMVPVDAGCESGKVAPGARHVVFRDFLLIPYLRDYQPFHPDFQYVFNSYYKGLGAHPNRAYRGLFSRPPLEQVQSYRAHVDRHMLELLQSGYTTEFADAVQLGLNHEQQHQELILTDIKHAFWSQPLRPSYAQPTPSPEAPERGVSWFGFDAGLYEIGYEGDRFAFDNERPRHQVYLNEFQIASRLATNGEYMAFMNDDGYLRPELWLSDGWDTMNAQGWRAPLYWEHQGDEWMAFTASGMQSVNPRDPVCHVSLYEADASRAGPRRDWRPKRNGKLWQRMFQSTAIFSKAGICIPFQNRREKARRNRCLVTYGSGRRVRMLAIRDSRQYRCARRIQRQVHGEPDGAARRIVCNSGFAHARNLPHFFPPHTRWQYSGIRLAK